MTLPLAFRVFLEVVAAVLFLLAGIGVPEAPKFKFIGWGLFLLTFVVIFGGLASWPK
jgi:hypothetical protein